MHNSNETETEQFWNFFQFHFSCADTFSSLRQKFNSRNKIYFLQFFVRLGKNKCLGLYGPSNVAQFFGGFCDWQQELFDINWVVKVNFKFNLNQLTSVLLWEVLGTETDSVHIALHNTIVAVVRPTICSHLNAVRWSQYYREYWILSSFRYFLMLAHCYCDSVDRCNLILIDWLFGYGVVFWFWTYY